MKVLFVSSGNSATGISPLVKRQGKSLEKEKIKIFYYKIQGKGLKGYFANILPLKKTIKKLQPDIIHAHYSLSGIIASLSGAKPLIVSLMGSDVKSSNKFKILVRFLAKYVWKTTIVKTEDMRSSIGLKNAVVIPNGVDIAFFKPLPKQACREKLGLDQNKTYILFAANPNRSEKNFALAKKAVEYLNQQANDLIWLQDVSHVDIPLWMNAADIVILSSLWEGSPNVIKEAMACNCSVVATDVGDIKWLFGNEPGHYLSSLTVNELAQKIQLALNFSEQNDYTKGRKRILKLGLDSESVAKRLINLYYITKKKHG